MPVFFSYREFLSQLNEGYYDPPEDNDSFTSEYESCIEVLEDTFRNKGIDFDSEKFWEMLMAEGSFSIFFTFDKKIRELTEKLYEKEYIVGFDKEHDTPLYSKTYDILRKEAVESSKNKKRGLTTAHFRSVLYTNIYLRLSREFWPIYEETLKSLHSMRGKFTGKKFGF